MEIMRKDTFLYYAVPAAPPSDAPHPAAPLSDAASAPHHAAPPPPFCLEDNTVFTEFWRIKGKCCIREMYSRTSGGAIYVFIEKKYSD